MAAFASPDDPNPSLPLEIEQAFLAMLDLPAGERQVAFDALLARWPAHVPRLRAWMTEVNAAGTAADKSAGPKPASIGPYRILEEIAKGGMGVVYAAEQTHPVHRRVAVKVIKPGMDSREVLARFEQERQALAMMNHPHIAKVLEAGATAEGRPFFAMEFVAGLPITTFVDKNRLTMRERLELFAQVCDGVQHAHQKGIIHRDLKPSNILVAFQDGKPHSKIIDFGVAKATQQRLTDKTIYTHQGQLVGTPEYMSPEQAEMTGTAVDTRTDIYSLGVLLYELLTGALPFDREAFRKAGLQGMLRILREQEPEKPSTKVTTIGHGGAEMASRRRTELGTLKRLLRGDLDWITIKALEKNPSRRYQSSGEFAADVLRHLRNEPVLAGPPTFVYRFSKLVRRHKGPIGAVAAVFVALVAGLVVSLWLLVETERARGSEQEALARSRKSGAEVTALKEELVTLASQLANAVRPPQAQAVPLTEAQAAALQARINELLIQVDALGTDEQVRVLAAGLSRLPPARPTALPELRRWLQEVEALTSDRQAKFAQVPNVAKQREMVAIQAQRAMLDRIRTRIQLAESLEKATLTQPAAAWRAAADYVARDLRYAGVHVTPQLGLIPLGPDPTSGLLEFAHYGSGTPVTRGEDRALVRPEGFSIVFVLIPPAHQTWVGAQKTDPKRPNFDPDANPNEPAARQVDVGAFFCAKYELTQAQWRALSEGDEPSRYLGEDNPVEFLDEPTAVRILGWREMELPSEIEWEYACRAGTTTPWYTGATRETLMGTPVAANIADVTLLERGAPRDKFEIWDDYDDDMAVHGPTGKLLPNAFGLHDTLGNVFELCILGAGPRTEGQPAVVRGGAWNRSASWARATARIEVPAAGTRFDNLGVRPILRLRN